MNPSSDSISPQRSQQQSDVSFPAHYVGRGNAWFGPLFDNPWLTASDPNLYTAMKLGYEWAKTRGFSLDGTLSFTSSPTAQDYQKAFPLSPVDWTTFNAEIEIGEIRCVWVGHATCLVKTSNLTFLTDPVFSDRCSPFQFIGPKRAVQPAFAIDDVQFSKLNVVVISHCHYDHLDFNSVVALYKKFGDELIWYVPLKLKPWFVRLGITNVVELDWWQKTTHKDATITFLPTQHWSNRYGFSDRKRTLWGSWLIESSGHKIWFGGDTGYCPVFKEIGQRYGPLDLSLIPIGAYDPRYFMKSQHVNPEEAVAIHKDVQSRQSIAIHCCTFSLTLEHMDEPPHRLRTDCGVQGLGETEFLALRHGEMLRICGRNLIDIPKTLPV